MKYLNTRGADGRMVKIFSEGESKTRKNWLARKQYNPKGSEFKNRIFSTKEAELRKQVMKKLFWERRKADPVHQFEAFRYTNIQPLWPEQNLFKYDKTGQFIYAFTIRQR